MSATSSNTSFCPFGVCVMLLLTPFLSFTEGAHYHTNRLLLTTAKNDTSASTEVTASKTNETLPANISSASNITVSIEIASSSPILDSTIEGVYATYNKTCYQCLYEQQLENAIYKILNNESLKIAPPNNTCSQCLMMEEFSNKTQSVGCMCGIYTTENPSVNDIPLRTKSFKNISCHELVPFEEACKKVCILGTLSYNELEPSTLCYHMPSGIEIKGYVQAKICREDAPWVFTGLASSNAICCDRGLPVNCLN
ncbi:unnamed protein product [Psylliodes chrysocephalus]|uniref:Uncharacterized protein n=1 Tax=Psylliodes chrysocephalus TaxID=3402493 RepID=A0A9P0CDQ3_9CUCU|nr:unnamed protein product [Psylliodes chrysocephala]